MIKNKKFAFSHHLFTFIFIFLPGILIWYFLGKDANWSAKTDLSFNELLFVLLGYLGGTAIIITIFLLMKWVPFAVLTYAIPMAIVMFAINMSYSLHPGYRFLIVLVILVTVTPLLLYLNDKIINKKHQQ
ncbi:hypothetical protein ACW95P_01085 [Candidatus Mycoplasma pogonae]